MLKYFSFMLILFYCAGLRSEKSVIAVQYGNLYQWHENRILVLVADSICKDVVIKVSAGTIWKDKDCQYRYTCDYSVENVRIMVGIESFDFTTWMEVKLFPVLPHPDPEPVFTFANHDTILLGAFRMKFYDDPMDSVITCPGLWIRCTIPEHGWCTHEHGEIKITAYTIKIERNNEIIFKRWNNSNTLEWHTCHDLFPLVNSGDRIIFDHIDCLIYGRERRLLKKPLIYVIR